MNVNNIDVYLNGRLEKSCVMNGVPIALGNTDKFKFLIPSGLIGKISKLLIFDRILEPNEIYENYSSGPFPELSFN
jgi:hypothetical protein